MTITLPDELRDDLERRAAADGFASVDEYVTDLLRTDADEWWPAELPPDARQRLLALAEEGLKSPPIADPEGYLAALARGVIPADPA